MILDILCRNIIESYANDRAKYALLSNKSRMSLQISRPLNYLKYQRIDPHQGLKKFTDQALDDQELFALAYYISKADLGTLAAMVCRTNRLDLFELLNSMGKIDYNMCLTCICGSNYLDLEKRLISLGANSCYRCQSSHIIPI